MKSGAARACALFSQSLVSLTAALVATGVACSSARADDDGVFLWPGNLLVSRVVYDNNSKNITAGTTKLPPNCVGAACATATASGTYPAVFNNVLVDPSFGITSKIVLDQMTPDGFLISALDVPNSSDRRISPNADQMVSSFSSKSEVALNLSTNRDFVTFMGYLAPVNTIDVSNSNTPGVIDPTNPVSATDYRVVAQVDRFGRFRFTKTNAYSGNNGRAAILNDKRHGGLFYTAGNAGNGSNPQPDGIIVGAGAQIMSAASAPLAAQDPGLPTPVGSFSITQLGDKADKVGKDTNFRGLAAFDDVVYTSKGSGGNGVNTVYFIDTSGFNAQGQPLACPNGVGLPSPTASLPTAPIVYNAADLQTEGVVPYNMCVLKGFPTATKSATSFPFGLWFANSKTLYVADEGDGATTFDATKGVYSAAAAQTTAGLQKWIFDDNAGEWKLAYVLQSGLNLGTPYTIAGYPTGQNAATGLPWSPATDGLRNITGEVHRDGTATIWAITSTVSGGGDQGADPNRLAMITDSLAATSLPAGEHFRTIETARFAEVLRGVSFTPGTGTHCDERDCDFHAER
jgi:hypothetical protein